MEAAVVARTWNIFSGLHEVGKFTSFIFNADLILVENSKIHLILEKNTLLPVDAKKILMMNVIYILHTFFDKIRMLLNPSRPSDIKTVTPFIAIIKTTERG